ncbi:hypothetical protein NQZ68_022064 [Dissostichus eleginoides]|nr:hypothetical protein NQZ68_022064 [Dissostichus eleginoides]
MCSEDIALFPDFEGRKAAVNVISVIQHTNSLSRPNSFEKSESFEHPGYQPSEKALSSQYSEQSDTDIFEDALSPESALLLRAESTERDSDLASLSSSSAAPSPGQPYQVPPKLVRQPNIQVPEIRVTEDKDTESPMTKEPEKQPQHVEEFQLPQRSDTLAQMPSEKLPPKKKRLRLADMEHSSGESSFESTCTSLSRSPSQESNLSHSSSFSMSFDREEGLKSASPTKQDDSSTSGGGPKQSEFLTVPGSGHSSHHQQREMRRSSSEQAPCTLPTEFPEMRSKSFDYGSLSSSRQGEIYSSASAMKERRRGYLVRQASLSVYPEAVVQEPLGAEMSIKQEVLEHGAWPGQSGSPHSSSDIPGRTKRVGSSTGGIGSHQHQQHHQHLLQQSISEDSLQDEPLYARSHQHRLQAQGSSSEGEYQCHEVMNKEVIQHYQSGPPYLSYQQPGIYWGQEAGQASRQQLTLQAQQQLQKLHIRSPGSVSGHPLHKQPPLHSLQQIHDQQPHDGKSESPSPQMYAASLSSRTSPMSQQNFASVSSKHSLPSTTTTSMLLQQVQPVFATQNLGSHAALPGIVVPVRIQTHVPSYGSVMYTSVSQLMAMHGSGAQGGRPGGADNNSMSQQSLSKPPGGIGGGISGSGFNLSHFLGQTDGSMLRYPPWKAPDSLPEQRLNTGIPLSLTSGTISTTDASGSGIGGSKRMLSPTSSLELFIETKQQKRVKEERMYGQIVKEMSAVELSGSENSGKLEKGRGQRAGLKTEGSMDDSERMSSSPPLSDFPVATKIAIPVRSSAPQPSDVPRAESFTPPLQIVTDRSPSSGGRDSPEELDVDDSIPEFSSSPQSMVSSNDAEDTDNTDQPSKVPVNMLVQLAANQSAGLSGAMGQTMGQTLLLTDVADVQQFCQFPSLRTMSKVSWCFLNYTKPNSTQTTLHSSVYNSWYVSSYNPNPLNLSTKAALAQLRSKQRRDSDWIYSTAAMSPPSSGKLVSSVAWKLRLDQLKPELMPVDVSHFGRKMKGVVSWDRSKEEQVEKEVSAKQPSAEPSRIKIFEGGVRAESLSLVSPSQNNSSSRIAVIGRRYKSNEDYVYVRGRGRGKYICEECGIRCKKPSMLKKHIRTHTDVRPYVCKFCNFAFKTKGNLTKHMKSKAHMKKCLELGVSMSSVEENEADEGDVGEEGQRCEKTSRVSLDHQFSDADDSDDDGDDVDDDDEDEDDYDGDFTPKTRSRSTSPQPFSLPSMSITAMASSHPHLSHLSHLAHPSDLMGSANKPPLFGYFTTVPSIQITPQAPPIIHSQAEFQRNQLLSPPSMDEDLPFPDPSSRLSSPGLEISRCPSPISPSSSPSSRRYLSPRRDLSPCAGHLSPRRDLSPMRHISPKRDLAGGYRRDLSPRRGHLSLLSPLSRPTSPAGRDYKRDLSPRGRHRAMIRAVSPRRGLHQHLHHPSQQSGSRGLRQGHQAELGILGRQRTGTEMETEHCLESLSPGERDQCSNRGNQSSPPHQVLFSHLPLHSQLQVRSPFPMIPIGGIQMVHSAPTSVTSALSQNKLQKNSSEDSTTSEASHFTSLEERGVIVGGGGGGVRLEQEEYIQTCTKAIASLCIDSQELRGGGGGKHGGRAPSLSCSSSSEQPSVSRSPPSPHPSSSPPQGPGKQHFSSSSSSSSSFPPETLHPPTVSKPLRLEREKEAESTKRSKDVS